MNVNFSIKAGERKNMFTDINGLSCSGVIGTVSEHYCLDYEIRDRINSTYCSLIGGGENTKHVKLEYE